jgi:hypothetical protein
MKIATGNDNVACVSVIILIPIKLAILLLAKLNAQQLKEFRSERQNTLRYSTTPTIMHYS